jgi:hypothetical protein
MERIMAGGRRTPPAERVRKDAVPERSGPAPGARAVTPSVPGHRLNRIQRYAGNRATEQSVRPDATGRDASAERGGSPRPGGVSVSRPGDADEREARHLARRALRGLPPTPIVPQVDPGRVTRVADRAAGVASSHPMSGLGSGQALPIDTRQMLRPRLGVDLGDVRIHTGAAADQIARALGAQAFTFGRDVVFASGRYDPWSRPGLELLAHELVHVGQHGHDRAALCVQRDDTELPPKAADFPIPLLGTLPTVTVNLHGIVFTFTDATNYYVAGPKWLQLNYIAVHALVQEQLSEDWAARAAQVGAARFGMTGLGQAAGVASGGELITSYATFRESLPFLGWLRAQGKTLTIAGDRFGVLELGAAARWLIDRMADDPDFQDGVLLGRPLPAWFDKGLQLDEMHRHGAQLRTFGDAKKASDARPDDPLARSDLELAAAALFDEVRKPADLMERVRADPALTAEPGYRLIWGTDGPTDPKSTTPPPVVPADAAPDRQFGAGFLGFLWTQQGLWWEMKSSSDRGAAARRKALIVYMGWAGQVKLGAAGDVELLTQPPTANMPPLPASFTATPTIGPPLYDASAESDYHFRMALQFPDVFEAFSSYRFFWSRRKVTDEDLKRATKVDPFTGGKRPSWGEVGAKRFSKANEYARADIKNYIDVASVGFGPPGSEVGLVAAGILLRYVALGFTWAVERILTPQNEQKVSFAGEGLGPGLYIVACSATPVKQGENFVRSPAVAWMPVFVRSPEEMAEIRLDALVKSQEDADARLAELQKKLARPVSWLDRDAMVAEVDQLLQAGQGLDKTIELQIDQLTERYTAIAADPDKADERAAVDKQLAALRDSLVTRGRRSEKLAGPVERVPAVFVTDRGQVIVLALEAVRKSMDTDAKGNVTSETWYVSDLTTAHSGEGPGSGKTKAEAVKVAVEGILRGPDRYGRGTLSLAVGKQRFTEHVDAGRAALVMEAIENVTAVASVAAVVAAPFTGGASMALLLPIGVIGAVPSGYRIATRLGEGTFRWDLSLVSDIVNVVGGIAGLGEVTQGLRMVRLTRGLMILGVGANGLGVLVMGVQVVEQLDTLADLPPGLRAARTFEILGNAFLQAGVAIGTAMVEKGRSSRTRESLTHAEGAHAEANLSKAGEAWSERLSPETQEALNKPGDATAAAAREAYRTMDPEVRRALTLCRSLCIPIPPPSAAEVARIRDFMKRVGIPDTHQNLREYLHDMNSRGELTKATESLAACQTLADAVRLFDAAIVRWAKDKGGSARKLGDRWEFTRADGSVVLEWEVDMFKRLAGDRATNSYFQAHHGVQHAWAEGRRIPGYTRDGCPAMLLRDSFAGSPHRRITDRQIAMKDSAPTRTYAEERALMIDDLRGSEVSKAQADKLVNASDKYFGDLYKAWQADLKAKGLSDAPLRAAFGTWTPK